MGSTTRAAITPMTIVQPISANVGCANDGRCSGTSEYAEVSSPVQSAMPTNTSEPIPAAMSPGIRMSGSVAPPSPLASITSTAATIGEPKITEIAAKLPAAPRTTSSCGGASRLASFTVKTATPAPIAMSGASGPSTSPSPSVAIAASATPGTMFGSLPPHRGDRSRVRVRRCPGAARSRTPPADRRARTPGNGHHSGTVSKPRSRWQVGEHPDLDLVDELEEPPADERHDDADDRREHEHRDEVPAAQDRRGIGRRPAAAACRFRRVVAHRTCRAANIRETLRSRRRTGAVSAHVDVTDLRHAFGQSLLDHPPGCSSVAASPCAPQIWFELASTPGTRAEARFDRHTADVDRVGTARADLEVRRDDDRVARSIGGCHQALSARQRLTPRRRAPRG